MSVHPPRAPAASHQSLRSGLRRTWRRPLLLLLALAMAILATPLLRTSAQEGADSDADGVPDGSDNCPFLPNPDQADSNANGLGDACESRLPATWDLRDRLQAGQITILTQSDFTEGMGMPLAAGDLNGDGRDDLVFSPFNSHQVKGWFSDGLFAREVLFNADGSAPPGGFVIHGTGSDFLGCEVEVGDLNGDGFGDLLMGAPGADAGGLAGAGVVHVLFGGQEIPPEVNLAAPPPGMALARVEGSVAAGHLGCMVASADADGDGIADLLTSAPDANGADGTRVGSGTFYVIRGGSAFAPGAVLSVLSAHLMVFGEDPEDRFGSQAAAGDFDGDSAMDLLISASQLFAASADGAGDGPNNARRDAGEAVVLFGPFVPGSVFDLRTSAPASRMIVYGKGTNSFLGEDVGSGDLDGDGVHDLIVGAVGDDGFAGATYVIRGGAALRGVVIDLAQGLPAGVVRFFGEFSFMGDTNQATNLNGDRFDDLMIGAPEDFVSGMNLFFVYGNSLFFDPALSRNLCAICALEFPHTRLSSEFFETAYTVWRGDVDGNGFLDAVFNALEAPGFAYVLEGARLTRQTMDLDGDGIPDDLDICPGSPDPGQEDTDGDGAGDACDNCRLQPNPDQADADADRFGDICDEFTPGVDLMARLVREAGARKATFTVPFELNLRDPTSGRTGAYEVVLQSRFGVNILGRTPCTECDSGNSASYAIDLISAQRPRGLRIRLVRPNGAVDPTMVPLRIRR